MDNSWTTIRLPADVYFTNDFSKWLARHTDAYTIGDYNETDYTLAISFPDAKHAVLTKLTWGGYKHPDGMEW